MAYLIDDHQDDTPPVQRRPVQRRTVPPLAKAAKPSLTKAHLVDGADAVQELIKAIGADPMLASQLRRKLDITSTTRQLEERVATLNREITLAKAVVATLPYRRPASSNGSHGTNSNQNQ